MGLSGFELKVSTFHEGKAALAFDSIQHWALAEWSSAEQKLLQTVEDPSPLNALNSSSRKF